jgi:hypothetical protein
MERGTEFKSESELWKKQHMFKMDYLHAAPTELEMSNESDSINMALLTELFHGSFQSTESNEESRKFD